MGWDDQARYYPPKPQKQEKSPPSAREVAEIKIDKFYQELSRRGKAEESLDSILSAFETSIREEAKRETVAACVRKVENFAYGHGSIQPTKIVELLEADHGE